MKFLQRRKDPKKNQQTRQIIQTTDSYTVYTNVIDPTTLSPTDKKKGWMIGGRKKNAIISTTSKSNNSEEEDDDDDVSLDQRIWETEAKIKHQIQQLASESFDNESDNGAKPKVRLVNTAGVLLFEGLGKLLLLLYLLYCVMY